MPPDFVILSAICFSPPLAPSALSRSKDDRPVSLSRTTDKADLRLLQPSFSAKWGLPSYAEPLPLAAAGPVEFADVQVLTRLRFKSWFAQFFGRVGSEFLSGSFPPKKA